MIEYNFFQLLVNFLGLSENHVTLAFDGMGFELGVLQNIREDVDRSRNVRIECLSVIYGVFALGLVSTCRARSSLPTYGSISIKMSTHILDFKLQL